MRGKHQIATESCQSTRNIPAYAGKTDNPDEDPYTLKEHPRVCGENGDF